MNEYLDGISTLEVQCFLHIHNEFVGMMILEIAAEHNLETKNLFFFSASPSFALPLYKEVDHLGFICSVIKRKPQSWGDTQCGSILGCSGPFITLFVFLCKS